MAKAKCAKGYMFHERANFVFSFSFSKRTHHYAQSVHSDILRTTQNENTSHRNKKFDHGLIIENRIFKQMLFVPLRMHIEIPSRCTLRFDSQ
jgi:hypothetical protein